MPNPNKERVIKQCYYCTNNRLIVDYKDINALRKFVSAAFKIAPQRRSGLCALHQRAVATAIKRARQGSLMPYLSK